MNKYRTVLWDNEPVELPWRFLEHIFDVYGGENYERQNRNYEYGISRDDFKNQYESEMIEDAREYIIENIEKLPDLITGWQNSIREQIESLKDELKFKLE